MSASPSEKFTTALVLLAAGFSRRMGKAKLLLPWGETTVLDHLLRQWHRLHVRECAVICGIGDAAIQAELDRLGFPPASRILNDHPERGMFSSIQCAARWSGWNPQITHWVIALGDQPHLRDETLEAILAFSAAHPTQVCQPRYDGHRRHPVVLPKEIFAAVTTSQAGSLREFLDAYPGLYYEAADPGLALDMDVPQDYEKALRLWQQNRAAKK